VEVRSHCLRAWISWRYAAFHIDKGDITFRWKLMPSASEYRLNWDRVLFRATLPYGVRKGEPVRISMTVVPPVWAGINNRLSIWTLDIPNNFQPAAEAPPAEPEAGSECELDVVAGPVERLAVYSRPMPGPDGTVRTAIIPEDRFGNPARFEQPLECQLGWEGASRQVSVQAGTIIHLEAPAAVGRALVSVPMTSLGARENVVNGRREGDQLVVTGNPVWAEAPNGLRPAFGEFHWHTDFSGDGQRPIAEALRCAREELILDYAAPGDHNPQGEKWQQTVEALQAAHAPGDFVTFFGWENGTDRGHENYYFTEPDHPLVCGGAAGIRGGRPDALVEQLNAIYRKSPFLAVPHHTNAVAETRKLEDDSPFWHPYPWDEPQEFIRLVEIMQCRGNQERNVCDDAWRGWHQNNRASVQDALARGYRVGFTGGTDNHCGWPGRAYAEQEFGMGCNIAPKSVVLTGVWTPHLDRQPLFDALMARHTWAVWDTRALVWFTVNNAPAGAEITVDAGSDLEARIRLSAEDALQTVELVSEGEAIWQQSFSELDVDVTVALGPAKTSTHIYLRALQRNGGIIYASPVFVTIAGHRGAPV
jgi:hypothetical protein